jgi:lipid II isoglutaminyl synthase (glutamine-hydrolysing)
MTTSRHTSPDTPDTARASNQAATIERGAIGRGRAALAVIGGRGAGALARRLRLGAGTSLPGLVAGRIDPAITTRLGAQLRHGSVVITGTNGKTTTSGLTAYALRAGGLRVWRNREGANLLRGVTAALVIRARPHGNLRRGGDAAAVFEVDEAAFPRVVAALQPRVIAITNLFRDQLDRYGEVDTVAERWRAALATLRGRATLALNADDPSVAALGDGFHAGPVLYFGVQDAADGSAGEHTDDSEDERERVDVIDARSCPRCRAPLTFTRRYYSHIGHWACPACGYARPTPQVTARAIAPDGLDGTQFLLGLPDGEHEARIALPGLYNVYNALAASAAALAMGIGADAITTALGSFAPAFGRAERIAVDGRTVRILLAKNPTGLNEVLRTLGAHTRAAHLLLALSDLPADGEDVSWIWDADLERLAGTDAQITATGTRAFDLGLRLKYAGATAARIEPEIAAALWHAIQQTPAGETLYIVPTYTAMLAVRGALERRGYAPHYWEQRDA